MQTVIECTSVQELLINLSQTVSEGLGSSRQLMLGGEAEYPITIYLIQKSLRCTRSLWKTLLSEHNRNLNLILRKHEHFLILICRIVLTHLQQWYKCFCDTLTGFFSRFFLLISLHFCFSASIFPYISILSHCYLQVMFSAVPTYLL